MNLTLENSFALQLAGLYAPWKPEGFAAPSLLVFNDALAAELGLPQLEESDVLALTTGNELPSGAQSLAQAYAGHQFGSFSPELGDGRALLLGEWVTPAGQRVDLQLKGSGRTPFSRRGDGKAAIGPVLREYLISEAMYHLGVPTTRVLAAASTGETIVRETLLPGAVLVRTGASHLRVGTLEYFAARGHRKKLSRLVAYAVIRHYCTPEMLPLCSDVLNHEGSEEAAPWVNPAVARHLLFSVAKSQAALIAQWMLVGFVHGVMNTDNSTLSGETIDYGPCAFLDQYGAGAVFSSIDHGGRYAFGNQPHIGKWNLARMGEALLRLLSDDREQAVQIVHEALELYQSQFDAQYLKGMRAKLGLSAADAEQNGSNAEMDQQLVVDFLAWLEGAGEDFTGAFRRLATGVRENTSPFEGPTFAAWYKRLLGQLRSTPETGPSDESHHHHLGRVAAEMDRVNPIYIPRNHLVEAALSAAADQDMDPFLDLCRVLRRPFDEQPGKFEYSQPAPAEFGNYRTFCGT